MPKNTHPPNKPVERERWLSSLIGLGKRLCAETKSPERASAGDAR